MEPRYTTLYDTWYTELNGMQSQLQEINDTKAAAKAAKEQEAKIAKEAKDKYEKEQAEKKAAAALKAAKEKAEKERKEKEKIAKEKADAKAKAEAEEKRLKTQFDKMKSGSDSGLSQADKDLIQEQYIAKKVDARIKKIENDYALAVENETKEFFKAREEAEKKGDKKRTALDKKLNEGYAYREDLEGQIQKIQSKQDALLMAQ